MRFLRSVYLSRFRRPALTLFLPRAVVRPANIVVLAAGLAFLAGCGGPADPHAGRKTAKIEVVIKQGGTPFTAGMVTLNADEPGNDAGGDLGPDGIAKIAVAPGGYTVVINPPSTPIIPGRESPAPAVKSDVPKAVQNKSTSPWKIEAKAGPNRFEFDLDSK